MQAMPDPSSFRQARFLISASKLAECPAHDLFEIALVGRSNCGKSSLINALCNNKKLAKTSSSPGKTRLINFFTIPETRLCLVDLPGYGYSQVSRSQKQAWEEHLAEYLLGRKQLKALGLLIDSRRGFKQLDLEMLNFAKQADLAYFFIFTKFDKLNSEESRKLKQHILETFPEIGEEKTFITSSTKNTGLERLKYELLIMNGEL